MKVKGVDHVGINVKDLETVPTTDLPSLGARVVLFLDPDGVTVEVSQKISSQEHKRS